MPVANQNFTLPNGKDVRVGDKVRTVPKGLDRLFDVDDDTEGDA